MAKTNNISPETPFEQMEDVLRTLKNALKATFKDKKYDITLDQWAVLKSIADADHANQSYLAQATQKDPAAITRMLEILVKRDLVQRKEEKEDKRAYHVKLTRKGAGLVKRARPVIEKVYADAVKEVSDRDLSTLKRISGKVIEGLA